MKKKTGKMLNGKGFYVALSLSVAMVGAACYFAYTQTGMEDITEEAQLPHNRTAVTGTEREAANIVTNVTKPVRITTRVPEPTAVRTTTAAAVTEAQEAAADSVQTEEKEKPADSRMQMPLKGDIICEFSNSELVRSKTTGAWQTHNGVDIKAEQGDSVAACASGKVSAVENDPLWGVTVTIDHGNGVVTKYCGLNSDASVQTGQEVSRGEEIGTVGNTADIESSEESHLHLEVMKNGSYTDPMEMM